MSVSARLATFGLALAVVFGIGAGLGAAFGPEPTTQRAPMVTHGGSPAPDAPMDHRPDD